MDEVRNEFDDLFEPFELDEVPPPPGELPPAPEPPPEPEAEAPPEQAPTIVCTSCGAANPATNRHCEQCGARLGSAPLPVAPPPLARATPGGRALTVLFAVVLVAALVALFINLRGGDDEAAPTSSSTTTNAPSTTVAFQELKPTTVEATSELTGFEAENLIDGDNETYWNDQSQRGNGAELTFRFAQPVGITSIELMNLSDEVRFKRNYRIKGYVVTVDDLSIDISGQLEDTNEPQRIRIASVETTTLTIEVRSTFPAEAVDGAPPFSELALGAVRFFGTESEGT